MKRKKKEEEKEEEEEKRKKRREDKGKRKRRGRRRKRKNGKCVICQIKQQCLLLSNFLRAQVVPKRTEALFLEYPNGYKAFRAGG